MNDALCPWREKCRNGNTGCYYAEPSCVRFFPMIGANLTEISGIVETPPGVDCDKFSQYFMNWIESMGWSFGGGFNPHEESYERSESSE